MKMIEMVGAVVMGASAGVLAAAALVGAFLLCGVYAAGYKAAMALSK